MPIATIIFTIAAVVAVAGAAGIVLFRDPIRSILSLVVVMLALAALFLLLSAQFIFAVQIIVYAGAVMVLFLFVIALLGPVRERLTTHLPHQWVVGSLVVIGLGAVILTLLGGVKYRPADDLSITGFGSVEQIAYGLFTTYLFPFEVTSLLLLVAAIGAIYLSRRRDAQ